MILQHIDAQTTFAGGTIAQATFTLTLVLLSWTDRRMRGMSWLAFAAVLNMGSAALRTTHPTDLRASVQLPYTLLFELSCLGMFLGLRWFAVRAPWRTRRWLYVTLGLTVAAALTQFFFPLAGMLIARLLTMAILSVTAKMLWQTRMTSLRPVLRVASGLIAVMVLVRLLTLGLHLMQPELMAVATALRLANSAGLTVLQFLFVAVYVAEAKHRLYDETRVDPLTGLRNRRAMDETAARAVRDAGLRREPLCLLMLDLDHFKVLNDTYGHALGDRALQACGAALVRGVGDDDAVARLGGEEFAVLLPGFKVAQAAELAEVLRASVAGLQVKLGQETASVTVSIGVSALQPGEENWRELLHRADMALYRAKRAGRDRVEVCTAIYEESGAPVEIAFPRQSMWRRYFSGRGPLL